MAANTSSARADTQVHWHTALLHPSRIQKHSSCCASRLHVGLLEELA